MMAMAEAATYSATEVLRDGRPVDIRAVRPDDRDALIAAIDRTSADSFYRRFFGVKHEFTKQQIASFMNIDFIDHVALVAVVEESARLTIVGGGRYVVVKPGVAEVAFAIVDEYQGHGIGAALLRHLATIARSTGLVELVAEVLAENAPMLNVFKKSGLDLSTKRESGVVHVTLRLI
jgi:RimJ/RimL family protein N-acetyltransferase